MATSRAVAAVKRTKVVEAVATGAYQAFWQAMDTREADAVDMRRQMGLQRLDALQRAGWDKAMGGDLKAALAIAWIIDQRTRLPGLDRHTGAPRVRR